MKKFYVCTVLRISKNRAKYLISLTLKVIRDAAVTELRKITTYGKGGLELSSSWKLIRSLKGKSRRKPVPKDTNVEYCQPFHGH
jgi:hypothetical protein